MSDPYEIDREPGATPATSPHSNEESGQRAIASLLRQLPEPEPPLDLTARVMAKVSRLESRPRVLRGWFGRSTQPAAALALAAGVAGLLFLSAPAEHLTSATEGVGLAADVTAAAPRAAQSSAVRPLRADRRQRLPARSTARVPTRQPVAFFARDPRGAALNSHTPGTLPPLHQRLDRQLDHLLHNPNAFFRRLERVSNRDQFVARLASRAARRGDFADVALRVRSNPHPLAPGVTNQFFQAAVVNWAEQR